MSVVLIVSPDESLASTVATAANSVQGFQTRKIAYFGEVTQHLQDEAVSLVILHATSDLAPQQLDSQLKELCDLPSRLSTIVIRDSFDAESDLRSLRMGVRECLTRPLDLRRLTYLIDSLTMRARLQNGRAPKVASAAVEQHCDALSPVMRQLLSRAQRIATRDVSILLNGETGVGKTHLARWIHQASPRASRPFVSINCGSLPANLIESELFGHRKGAFTGADEEREGKFAYVQDGTLLLDEIDALPLPSQAKLLRVLDEGVFEKIGCNKSLPFRGRLIAASNRSLEDLIETDQFRADLYYRLNVVQFHIPALRERIDELHSLVRHFLSALAQKHEIPLPAVDAQVWHTLETYSWPGNLRELRNMIEHAITHCEGTTIGLDELPPRIRNHAATGAALRDDPLPAILQQSRNALARARQEGEYRYLLGVLDLCDNNRSQAARTLGISRTALYKKLVSFGIS